MKAAKTARKPVPNVKAMGHLASAHAADAKAMATDIGKFLKSGDRRLLLPLLASHRRGRPEGPRLIPIPPSMPFPTSWQLLPSNPPYLQWAGRATASFTRDSNFTGTLGADAHHPNQNPYDSYRSCRTSDGVISLQLKSGGFIAYEFNPPSRDLYEGVVQTFGGLRFMAERNAVASIDLEIPDVGSGVYFYEPAAFEYTTLLQASLTIVTLIFFRASSAEIDLSDVRRPVPIYESSRVGEVSDTTLPGGGAYLLQERFQLPAQVNDVTIKVIAELQVSRTPIPPATKPSGLVAVNLTDPHIDGFLFMGVSGEGGGPRDGWGRYPVDMNPSAGGIRIRSISLLANP